MADAWQALHDPKVFQVVSRPFLHFQAVTPTEFPTRYESHHHYVVEARAFGFLPLGQQEINPISTETRTSKTFTDKGRGLSGPLGMVTTFHHQMTLEPSGTGHTLLRDELEFDAGWANPLLWVSFRFFWWWRHRRMLALAPSWLNPIAAQWDKRYRDKLWSGTVNPTLVSAIENLPPGRALDVGAGEGADALWLAEKGCDVTAVDASPLALQRGEAQRVALVATDKKPRRVRWIAEDVLNEPLPEGPYDLVTAHFLHLPAPERKKLWKKLLLAVAPGGSLLIVGHALSDVATGVGRPPAELMFSEKELRSLIPQSWSKVTVSNIQREQPGPEGTPIGVTDIVLFATR